MAKQTLHEKMMQMHTAGRQAGNGGRHAGAPAEIASYDISFQSKRQIAEGTYAFTFTRPAEFTPKAGQHVRVTLIDPPETDAEGGSRFLSFASSPQDPNLVFAMRMRDTAFKRLFARLQPGDKVLMQMRLGGSPRGSFEQLAAVDTTRPAVYIVGGIGIVPAYSMIKDALERRQPRSMYLFYSNRRPEDAPFLAELQQLAKHNPQFKLIATMSEPDKSAQTWPGETGRIDHAMLSRHIDNLQNPIYFVAGLTEMVNAMQVMLATAGVSKEHIHAEEFGAFTAAHATETPIRRSHRDYLLPGLLVVLIIAMAGLHLTGAVSLSHADLSYKNPMLYLMIGLLIGLIALKLTFLRRFKQSRGAQTMHDISGHKRK